MIFNNMCLELLGQGEYVGTFITSIALFTVDLLLMSLPAFYTGVFLVARAPAAAELYTVMARHVDLQFVGFAGGEVTQTARVFPNTVLLYIVYASKVNNLPWVNEFLFKEFLCVYAMIC